MWSQHPSISIPPIPASHLRNSIVSSIRRYILHPKAFLLSGIYTLSSDLTQNFSFLQLVHWLVWYPLQPPVIDSKKKNSALVHVRQGETVKGKTVETLASVPASLCLGSHCSAEISIACTVRNFPALLRSMRGYPYSLLFCLLFKEIWLRQADICIGQASNHSAQHTKSPSFSI